MERRDGRISVPKAIRRQLRHNPDVRMVGPTREIETTAVVLSNGRGVTVFCRDVAKGAMTGFHAGTAEAGFKRLLTRDFSYDE